MSYILKKFRAARTILLSNTKKNKLDIASPLGGDVEEIGHFQSGKIRSHGTIFFASSLVSDVAKISHFEMRSIPSHGSIFCITSWGRC